jgi:hypothetical protein
MQTQIESIATTVFRSDARQYIHTSNPSLAKAIAFADAHPVVWEIVTGTKSKAFGKGSCVYIGWAQKSTVPEAVLERARHFASLLQDNGQWSRHNSIFTWRAHYTFEHYRQRGFTGGFFQQHDARYPRSCLKLDYTPDTLHLVLDKFCAWMDRYYETTHITLDGRIVREFRKEGRHG